jgi:ubiquinone/menaquinone biosynthesis C-methylase UbiE
VTSTGFLNPRTAIRSSHIREGMKVADFGVGSGFFTREAARSAGEAGRVYAVDIDQELLARLNSLACAEGIRNIEYVRGDFEKLRGSGLADGSVDVVLLTNTLFQIQDKNALVEEIWRVLERGGRAVIIDWKASFDCMGPHESHIVPMSEARALFERGGFTFIEELPAGEYHWGVILRKKN